MFDESQRARRLWDSWRMKVIISILALALHGALAFGEGATNALPANHAELVARAAAAGKTKKDRSVVTEEDREWWAFQKLKEVQPPKVKNAEMVRTPIDAFILAALEEKNLTLNPAADRRALLRRASFELLGLPPKPEEVEAFDRDESPTAWESATGKLLDKPEFGERWARHWLDVARFAESSGFEHDYDRPNAYHYRDFVIKALNADMPYNQFVQWQLAGDEFEPDNPLALMATGFLGAGCSPHRSRPTKWSAPATMPWMTCSQRRAMRCWG